MLDMLGSALLDLGAATAGKAASAQRNLLNGRKTTAAYRDKEMQWRVRMR